MASTPSLLEILKMFLVENAFDIAATAASFAIAQRFPRALKVFAVLGIVLILRMLQALVQGIWASFLRPEKDIRHYGSWALVTGGTDGIGKAICHQFAQRGVNIFIVGRSEAKLQDMVNEFKELYKGVQCSYVVADFSEEDVRGAVAKIEKAIQGHEVGILVNNVGVSYPYARFFHEVDDELMTKLLRINVESTTRMVHMVLPQMVERRRGCIINMGSGAASILTSDPLYSLYAATKGFIDQFSKSLNVEYHAMGIDIQCQAPLYVATKMTRVRRPSIACPSADTYAKSAMRWIGYEARVTPYIYHRLLWGIRSFFRESTIDNHRLKLTLGIRKKGLARDALKGQTGTQAS